MFTEKFGRVFFSVRIFLAIFFQLRLLPGHRSCHVVFPDSSGSYNTAINTEYLVPRVRLNSRSRIITQKALWRIFPDFPLPPMLVFPEVIILPATIMRVQRPSGERNNSITMWDIGGPPKKSGDYIPREFLQNRRKVKVFFTSGCI